MPKPKPDISQPHLNKILLFSGLFMLCFSISIGQTAQNKGLKIQNTDEISLDSFTSQKPKKIKNLQKNSNCELVILGKFQEFINDGAFCEAFKCIKWPIHSRK